MRRGIFSRFGILLWGFGCWLGSNDLFLLLYQAAHRVGRLGTLADPVLGPFDIEQTVLTSLLWIVRADDLDEFTIPRTAAVGHYHSVVRPVLRALSA